MATITYTVAGMTCGHCAASVTEQLKAVTGVQDVTIDLATGAVNVVSTTHLDPSAVRKAVENAGYQLA